MAWAESDLDFSVVDRARTLGDLLRLLFALMEAFGPKNVADLLTRFDPAVVVDPETAGRWLRNERRPSKPHLRLIVRLLQSQGLVGTPPARDRVFMRIAAFYAKLDEPEINPIRPSRSPDDGTAAARSSWRPPEPQPTSRFRELRENYELALALQFDLRWPGDEMLRFDARRARPRPMMRDAPSAAPGHELLTALVSALPPSTPSPWLRHLIRALRRWRRL